MSKKYLHIPTDTVYTLEDKGPKVLKNNDRALTKVVSLEIVLNGKDWKEYKKVLHTTRDGVDVVEGDIIFYVDPSTFAEPVQDVVVNSKNSTPEHPVEHWYANHIYFYSLQAAKRYISENKPMFSYNDIAAVIKDFTNLDGLSKIHLLARFSSVVYKKENNNE